MSTPYYQIEARQVATELRIYGPIGGNTDPLTESQTTKELIAQLDHLSGRPITIYINSQGGSLIDGIAIYNCLKRQRIPPKIVVDGWALSAASLIVMAGRPAIMGEGAMLMLHNPQLGVEGTAQDLRSRADLLDTLRLQMVKIYQGKSGQSETVITDWMDAETWFDGATAIAARLADHLAEDKNITACGKAKLDPIPPNAYKPAAGFIACPARLTQHYQIVAHAARTGVTYIQALDELHVR